jgi:hypothetical protein
MRQSPISTGPTQRNPPIGPRARRRQPVRAGAPRGPSAEVASVRLEPHEKQWPWIPTIVGSGAAVAAGICAVVARDRYNALSDKTQTLPNRAGLEGRRPELAGRQFRALGGGRGGPDDGPHWICHTLARTLLPVGCCDADAGGRHGCRRGELAMKTGGIPTKTMLALLGVASCNFDAAFKRYCDNNPRCQADAGPICGCWAGCQGRKQGRRWRWQGAVRSTTRNSAGYFSAQDLRFPQ